MRFSVLFLIIFLTVIEAQRRKTNKPDEDGDGAPDDLIPPTPPMRSTTPRGTTTTTAAPINYTDANLVETDIKQALEEFHESMLENLLEFNQITRENFDMEIGRIFEELEKDEFYNLYEGKCQPDQLTTFDEYQSSLDAFIKVSLEHELKKIEENALAAYNRFNNPFQEYVKASLITPLTTALRFNKVPKSVATECANYYVPLIIDFIEENYLGVMDCFNLTIYYNETYEYQEIVNSLYRETASYLTTCTNTACFKKACWKTYVLVLRAGKATCDAMSSIYANLKLEVIDMENCVKQFHTSTFVASTTGKDSLRSQIVDCLR